MIVETVKNGTLVEQGKKWRAGNTSIRMMLRMGKKTNNTHSIRWLAVAYFENEEDWKKRKIKEALIINAMDSKQRTNLENGLENNQYWNKFNPNSKKIVRKKEKS